jgi:dienelactone hydrolase
MRTIIALAVLCLGASARADYAQLGAQAYTKTSSSVTVNTANYAYDVYTPDSGGPWPLIGLAHGFLGSKTDLASYAQRLASRGNVVVTPQFPAAPDQAGNAAALLAAMDDAATKAPAGRVDTARQGVGGHSAGGLSAFLAGALRPSLKAVVLLDPVEANGLGAAKVGDIRSPTTWLLAEPSSCNASGNGAAWYASVTAPKARMKFTGSAHCDLQDPVNTVCSFGCGYTAGWAPYYQRHAVAWFQYFVSCELAARTAIDGAEHAADVTANKVTDDQFAAIPAAPCGAADGGAGGSGGSGGSGGGVGGAGGAGGTGGGAATGGGAGGAGGGSATGGGTGGTGGGAATGGGAGGAGGGAATGGGAGGGGVPGAGCGCASGAGPLAALAWLAAVGARVRRRRGRLSPR